VVVVAAVLVKVAPHPRLGIARDPGVVAIGALDVAAVAAFTFAATRAPVSVAAALGSLYPVVTVGLARVVLGERMRSLQRAGAAIAIAAAVALAVVAPA
jgi:drug/metabolite transporter (DMT)-like permease